MRGVNYQNKNNKKNVNKIIIQIIEIMLQIINN